MIRGDGESIFGFKDGEVGCGCQRDENGCDKREEG